MAQQARIETTRPRHVLDLNALEVQALSQGQSGTDVAPNQPGCICITAAQLSSVILALGNQDVLGTDVSEMSLMQLQLLLDTRSKLLQTASDKEKSMTDAAIVRNLK